MPFQVENQYKALLYNNLQFKKNYNILKNSKLSNNKILHIYYIYNIDIYAVGFVFFLRHISWRACVRDRSGNGFCLVSICKSLTDRGSSGQMRLFVRVTGEGKNHCSG